MRQNHDTPSIAVVMGVAGAGKTTVGERLAERLDWEFIEGDRLHPPENVAKMQSGHPLTDADRAPWLAAIGQAIDAWQAEGACGVVTCSALKRDYRRRIIGDRAGCPPRLPRRIARADRRTPRRPARAFHAGRACSTASSPPLEPPGPDENPITVSIDQPVDRIVEQIAAVLRPIRNGQ